MAELRRAIASDLPQIAWLHVQSWQTAYRGVVPEELLRSMSAERSLPGWQKTYDSFPDNLAVAYDQAGIAGFCCAGPVVDSDKNHPFTFEIYGIHVRPDCHRKGLGSELVVQAFDRMRALGLDGAIVWTLEALAQSRRFYEKQGGVVVKSGTWTIGPFTLPEVAYGWPAAGLHSRSVPTI
jgi:ribosomal protein S18 acetylase RimI-like enzyme